MVQQAAVHRRRAVRLPAGTDAVAVAMNPGLSSRVALRRRVQLRPGASALVLDATGNVGRLAVQIARRRPRGPLTTRRRPGGAAARTRPGACCTVMDYVRYCAQMLRQCLREVVS